MGNGQEWTKSNYKNNDRNREWIFDNEDGIVHKEKEYSPWILIKCF